MQTGIYNKHILYSYSNVKCLVVVFVGVSQWPTSSSQHDIAPFKFAFQNAVEVIEHFPSNGVGRRTFMVVQSGGLPLYSLPLMSGSLWKIIVRDGAYDKVMPSA